MTKKKEDKPGDYLVPYSSDGSLLSYAPYCRVPLSPNEPFHATLRFDQFLRGRSAAHAYFVDDETKRQFPMFLTDLAKAIPLLKEGRITGKWCVAKRGENYGIRLMEESTSS